MGNSGLPGPNFHSYYLVSDTALGKTQGAMFLKPERPETRELKQRGPKQRVQFGGAHLSRPETRSPIAKRARNRSTETRDRETREPETEAPMSLEPGTKDRRSEGAHVVVNAAHPTEVAST